MNLMSFIIFIFAKQNLKIFPFFKFLQKACNIHWLRNVKVTTKSFVYYLTQHFFCDLYFMSVQNKQFFVYFSKQTKQGGVGEGGGFL